MLKTIHEEVQRYYKNKQQKNLELQSIRRKELNETIEGYKDIDVDLQNIFKKIAILMVSDKNEEIQNLKEQIEDLIAYKQKLLLEHSYPLNYLENVYDCSICKDNGFTKEGNHCVCYKNKISWKLMELSKIDNKLFEENFDTFNFDYYNKSKDPNSGLVPFDVAQSIFNVVNKACENKSSELNNMYIYGPVGVGKTFLLNSIAKKTLDNNLSVIYLPSQELFNIINAYKFHNDNHPLANQSYYNFLCNCDVLLIDDLGTEASTNVTQSEFFYILDLRIRTNKMTVITSNLQLNNLEQQYSQRISSRIIGEFALLKLIGDDIRYKKKYKM